MPTTLNDTGPRFATICAILNDLHEQHLDADWLGDFFEVNDLGVPMAILFTLEAADPTDHGIAYVHDSWRHLCELLEVDTHIPYGSVEELLTAAQIDDLDSAPTQELTALLNSVERMLKDDGR